MKGKICALLMYFICTLTLAVEYQINLPIKYNGKVSAELKAVLSGMTLVGINTQSFTRVFVEYISSHELENITAEQGSIIPLSRLNDRGVQITLNTREMMLDVIIPQELLKVSTLRYGNRDYFAHPTDSASWNVLNNFNLETFHDNNGDADHELEWRLFGNLGGHSGINVETTWYKTLLADGTNKEYRGDIVFTKDYFQKPMRVEFGDLYSSSHGHIFSAPIGGVKISKSASRLQPLRKRTPSIEQEFYLQSTAEIAVIVNGFVVSRTRLPAGKYSLSDLPLATGNNEVQIRANYTNGTSNIFNFSNFYNGRILAKGQSDYSIALGSLSNKSDGHYDYSKDVLLNGFFEYGITNNTTLSFASALSQNGQLINLNTAHGNNWGNFNFKLSSSNANDVSGYALTLDSEHSIWGSPSNSTANLRLGVEKRSRFINNPWYESASANDSERGYIDYTYYASDSFSLGFNFNYSQQNQRSAERNTTGRVNYRIGNFVFGAQYKRHQNVEVDDYENVYYVNISWSRYNSRLNSLSRLSYVGQSETITANYHKLTNQMVGEFGYDLMATHDQNDSSFVVKSDYTMNVVRAEAEIEANDTSNKIDNSRINLSTSIAIADGYWGVGNNIQSPYVFVKKHESLDNSEVSIIPGQNDHYMAHSGNTFAGITNLSTSYTHNRLLVDVKNAPIGYDIGEGTYDIVAGSHTAHIINIGSDEAYTVIGKLIDDKGEFITLSRGVLKSADKEYAFFTNKKGRFVVEGIGLGNFQISVGGFTGAIMVEKSTSNLIRIGTINLVREN